MAEKKPGDKQTVVGFPAAYVFATTLPDCGADYMRRLVDSCTGQLSN